MTCEQISHPGLHFKSGQQRVHTRCDPHLPPQQDQAPGAGRGAAVDPVALRRPRAPYRASCCQFAKTISLHTPRFSGVVRFESALSCSSPDWASRGGASTASRATGLGASCNGAAAAVRPTPPGNNRRLRLGFSACWLGGAGMPLLLAWLTGVAALLAPRTVSVTVTWLLPAVRRGNVRALFLTGPSISHLRYLLSRCWAGYVGRPPPLDVEIQVRSPLGQKGGAARPHARRLRHQATRSTARLAWTWSRTAPLVRGHRQSMAARLYLDGSRIPRPVKASRVRKVRSIPLGRVARLTYLGRTINFSAFLNSPPMIRSAIDRASDSFS